MMAFPVSSGALRAPSIHRYKPRNGSAEAKPAASARRRRDAPRRPGLPNSRTFQLWRRRKPADNCDQRVAFVLDPFRQAMRLDIREPGMAQIEFDKPCMTRI